MDVLTTAWKGAGCLAPVTGRRLGLGCCARCGSESDLVPVSGAISKTFTAFDGWRTVTGRGLCPVCAWGYTTPGLRRLPHQVRREPATLRQLTLAEVATRLLGGGMGVDDALVVPLRPGRKHLVPTARWGRVTIDDAQLSWTNAEAKLLHNVLELRRRGFGSRMVREPAPPFAVLTRLPRHHWPAVLASWRRLERWRSPSNPWLDLALHVTTTLEEIP